EQERVPGAGGLEDAVGDGQDALAVCDGRADVLLDHDGHGPSLTPRSGQEPEGGRNSPRLPASPARGTALASNRQRYSTARETGTPDRTTSPTPSRRRSNSRPKITTAIATNSAGRPCQAAGDGTLAIPIVGARPEALTRMPMTI